MPRRRSYYDDYYPRYQSTAPIPVDGIKAKSQKGQFAKNWWADKWIAALERLMDSGRLSRGRSYARRGQVLNIDLTPGHVASRVQGSQRSPYKVSIDLKPLADADWDKAIAAMSEQAIFAAKLLAGEMPPDIEEAFQKAKVPLFPASKNDLVTSCSCPDWANPCKHVAAVYFLLGERFDQDPFLLFELRGRSKQQIIEALRASRAAEAPPVMSPQPTVWQEAAAAKAPSLAECLEAYWEAGEGLDGLEIRVAEPPVALALLKRLGEPSFWPEGDWQRRCQRVYAAATRQALRLAFGEG